MINPITGERLGMSVAHAPAATAVRLATLRAAAPSLLPAAPLARNWAEGMALAAYGNDLAADCVEATAYYRLDMLARLHGGAFAGSAAQALADYRKLSGWDGEPGSSSDAGSNPSSLFALYLGAGLACGAKLRAVVEIDHRDHDEVRIAINAFGGVYVDGELPINLSTTGRWDVPASPSAADLPSGNGKRKHAWLWTGYDDKILTSAKGVHATNAWTAACVTRAWALLDDALFAGGVAPSGLVLAELESALAALKVPS